MNSPKRALVRSIWSLALCCCIVTVGRRIGELEGGEGMVVMVDAPTSAKPGDKDFSILSRTASSTASSTLKVKMAATALPVETMTAAQARLIETNSQATTGEHHFQEAAPDAQASANFTIIPSQSPPAQRLQPQVEHLITQTSKAASSSLGITSSANSSATSPTITVIPSPPSSSPILRPTVIIQQQSTKVQKRSFRSYCSGFEFWT
ncbi:hypothetical protein B0T25DRAFT_517528 [Lasiosphaeria hispida]|uniref:Uncharacterized protein n=1 Tax=Lasiosphaeria hispida TaxID=260671 RepID=A0AAJ0HGY2_9PEZI|nr:hypothetical protein B0T25DRAFT_517528 [Lasiosphaeria hispida]